MYFKFLLSLSLFFTLSLFSAHHESTKKVEYSKKQIIKIAMSAAPSNVSLEATIIDSNGKTLRKGTNGWTCMPGTPPNENVNPMCVDKAWQKWLEAFMDQTPYNSENESFGMSYMLVGDQAVDNNGNMCNIF